MIRTEQYSREKQREWDDFIDRSKSPMFMFKRGFMEYHSDRFKDFSLMFYDNDKLIGVLPASIKDRIITSHAGLTYGGFVPSFQIKQHTMLECFEALRKRLKMEGGNIFYYKAIPYIYNSYPAQEDLYALFRCGGRLVKSECSCVVDLHNPLKMCKGRKAQVSRAKKEGVEIKESNDFAAFLRLENNVLMVRHNTTAVHSAQELELLVSRFPESIKLFIAQYEEQMIAATLLFIYPDVVHTQYMAANNMARKIGGLDLLIKTLMEQYAGQKHYFDFGISTEQEGKYLNEGLIAQKEGFGGRVVVQQTWGMALEE